jgi:hypothetical protein
MTISERATASISNTPRNASDRDRLREEWRLVAKEWAAADSKWAEYDEGRKVLLAEMTLRLVEGGMTVSKAELTARCSDQFKSYLRKLYDARRLKNDLEIDKENASRAYWDQNNSEATERAERRMSR